MPLPAQIVRFGPFQLDVRAAELRSNGSKTQLPEQPFQVLTALLEKPGEVVTREELRQRLWGADTFVDFEHGLNTAVKRLREALGDSAENPRFIETLPRHGYRLIVPVQVPHVAAIAASPARRGRLWLAIVGAVVVVAVAAGLVWQHRRLERPHAVKIESLAVLPLENLAGNPEEEYFADGMTEALITELGKLKTVRVISRHSVMHYKGTSKTVPQIAKELNVHAVIEGSVLRTGSKVRITAQLIQANPERHLWSESYERDLRDIVGLQRELIRAIAGEIKINVQAYEHAGYVAGTRRVHPEAYDSYLRGRYFWHLRTGGPEGSEQIQKALGYFQRSLQADPEFAPSYAGLADAYYAMAYRSSLPIRETFEQARTAARRALELDSSLAEAHVALGTVKLHYDWDWKGAEEEFKRAIELDPGYAYAHYAYSELLAPTGRHPEARAELSLAQQLDPNPSVFTLWSAFLFYYDRHYDQAMAEFQHLAEIEPRYARSGEAMQMFYAREGWVLAIEAFARPDILTAKDVAELREQYQRGGNPGYCGYLLKIAEKDSWSSATHAELYACLGRIDEGIGQLQEVFAEHNSSNVYLKVNPGYDPLRSDPRFQELLRRMRYP